MEHLRVKSIHAAYRKKEVLRGVSVAVAAGEIVTLVGPNGSGKSTLLKVIAGFLKPLEGEVWFDGRPVTPLAPHERVQRGLAYFMQGGRVFTNLSVRENLEVAGRATPAAERDGALAAAWRMFPRLKELAEKRAGTLSGGERQSLALSMVILPRPSLVLLDEPTAGLAPLLARHALGRVRELNDEWKTTFLLVEHNLKEALAISHRALVLAHGKIVFETERPLLDLTARRLEQFFRAPGGNAQPEDGTGLDAARWRGTSPPPALNDESHERF